MKETIHLFGCNDLTVADSAIVANEKDVLLLESGGNSHKFPFSCQLSSQLPSSVEGKFGYIRYQTTAVVDILNDDIQSVREKKSFTVVRVDNDASTHGIKKLPLMVEITKTFRCRSIYNGKPLCVLASTYRTSYHSNEKIILHVKFVNRTFGRVNKISTKLFQLICYKR